MRWTPLVAACLLLVAGCAAPTQGTDEESPISLTTELSKETIQAGETLELTVTVENVSDQAYTYDHPGCPPEPIRANVISTDEEIRLYTYGQEGMAGACAVREVTLEPGETVTTTVNWNGLSQEAQPDPHNGSAVASGEHTLKVELARADGGATFAEELTVEVQA